MTKQKEKKNIFKKFITIIFVLGVLTILYSHFIGTKGLFIREYPIINNNIPESFNGFKIVHFTDLHYGTTYKKKETNKLVATINELKPDLVVFTGDLLDQYTDMSEQDIKDLSDALNSINATVGKYIVSGNHDGVNKSFNKVIEQLNFTFLDNKNEFIYYQDKTPIILVGLSDYLELHTDIETAFNYENEENYYTILLAHEPDLIDSLADKKIDLILSGHSHNGQVRAPFIGKIYTPVGSKKYYDEKYELDDKLLFISGGLGTSTAEFRLFCHPSFNFYRLYSN